MIRLNFLFWRCKFYTIKQNFARVSPDISLCIYANTITDVTVYRNIILIMPITYCVKVSTNYEKYSLYYHVEYFM